MPILDVDVVGSLPARLRSGLARKLADAAAAVFETGPGQTWVQIHELDPDLRAENGVDTDDAPVVVRVLREALPSMPTRAREAAALSDAFAALLERPRVHVLFEPPAAGRVAFGGALVPGPARARHATAARWESLYGYSRAVRVGDTIWVTGTVALSTSGEPVGLEDAGAQTTRCLAIVGDALEALGGSLRDIVRTRLFVTNIARDHDAVGRAHAAVFGDVRPATTMVEVRALIGDWMLVEVEADAQLGG